MLIGAPIRKARKVIEDSLRVSMEDVRAVFVDKNAGFI